MSQQIQLSLFGDPPKMDQLINRREDQWFDRKSFRISARDLADVMIGFANADGGRIAVGIHNGEIEGISSDVNHLNELKQAAIDFADPPVRFSDQQFACTNRRGGSDWILVLDIESSERIHRNRRGVCLLRIGDETRELRGAAERELAFDKHEAIFDSSIVPSAIRDDLDMDAVAAYVERVHASSIESLLRSRHLYLDFPHRTGVTQAGLLLFGRNPPVWNYIRYIRYSGTTVETGERSNLLEDISLYGSVPSLVEQAKNLLSERLQVERLTSTGRFGRVLILPEFAWLEAIVNAVTHRSYSLQGDGIRVRDFADRLEVESPGRLPGLVRVQNIRNTRFSRNPHIALVMAEMTGYVRQLNEGVQRMFEEMERSRLRDPVYTIGEANVRVTLYKSPVADRVTQADTLGVMSTVHRLEKRIGQSSTHMFLLTLLSKQAVSARDIAQLLAVTPPTARNYLRLLENAGLIVSTAKSANDPTAKWAISESGEWQSLDGYLKVT